MLQTQDEIPDTWEDYVVFPARFVVYAPRDVRLTLHAFGKTLYRMLLHQSGNVSTGLSGSPVRQELEALFAELCLIRDFCLSHPSFDDVGKVLGASVARRGHRFKEVVGEQPKAFMELPTVSFRPFLLTQLGQEDLEPIATLSEILGELFSAEVHPMDLASALAFDLRWVGTVLSEHVASRASLASLDREDTHLASLADDLAKDVPHSIAELMKAGGL